MSFELDGDSTAAIFTLPGSDGSFDPDHFAYLRAIGRRRPSIFLAFPPKCAGTFLRTAAILAVNGQLMRVVHAQGGRDATPYLPTYIRYLCGGFPADPLVTHAHMQALPANRHFIEALDLKPVIMVRSVPDMLVSYLDMLDAEPASPDHWLNIAIPANFAAMDATAKADFLIDTVMPWYASYYATWLAYAAEAPQRVLALRYADLRRDPVAVLCAVLEHSGLPRAEEMCELAVAAAGRNPSETRFNRGEEGRGTARFTPPQLGRIARLLEYYPPLRDRLCELMPIQA
ncbi:MAG TPA: sulfotransferase domain-containing protein [Rhizomicrobium sp.]